MLVPDAVRHLISHGVAVVVEPDAGLAAMIRDERFVAAGATIGDPWWLSHKGWIRPAGLRRFRYAAEFPGV